MRAGATVFAVTRRRPPLHLGHIPGRRAVLMPRHVLADHPQIGRGDGGFVDQLAGEHDHDPVRQFEDLVQILADQQHGGATVARLDVAGAAGLEPAITGPKPDALPLGYAPIQECRDHTQAPSRWQYLNRVSGPKDAAGQKPYQMAAPAAHGR